MARRSAPVLAPLLVSASVPPCDPPFDDELPDHIWPSLHQLAFDWPDPFTDRPPAHSDADRDTADGRDRRAAGERDRLTAGRPGRRAAGKPGRRAAGRPGRRTADGSGRGAAGGRVADEQASTLATRQIPVAGTTAEARLAVRSFIHLFIEVINGYRPANHLRRFAVPMVAMNVVAQASAAAARVTEARRQALQTPGPALPPSGLILRQSRPAPPGTRTAAPRSRPGPRRPPPVALLRLRCYQPHAAAVEAAAALLTGNRSYALALRMELHQEAWATTVLRLL